MNKSFNSPKWVSVLFSFFVLFAVVFSAGKAVAADPVKKTKKAELNVLEPERDQFTKDRNKAIETFNKVTKEKQAALEAVVSGKGALRTFGLSTEKFKFVYDMIIAGKTCKDAGNELAGEASAPSDFNPVPANKGKAVSKNGKTEVHRSIATEGPGSLDDEISNSTEVGPKLSSVYTKSEWEKICTSKDGVDSFDTEFICNKYDSISKRGVPPSQFNPDKCKQNFKKAVGGLKTAILKREELRAQQGLIQDLTRSIASHTETIERLKRDDGKDDKYVLADFDIESFDVDSLELNPPKKTGKKKKKDY